LLQVTHINNIIASFAKLIRRIKFASFRSRLIQIRKDKEEAYEMKYQRGHHQRKHVKKEATFLPIIPLVRIKLPVDEKDKSAFITLELKVRAGSGAGTPSYKKNIRTFEEGSPQEWMDLLLNLKEIWKQNAVVEPTDQAATISAILKGDTLTAFETALEDARNPEDGIDDELVDMTLEHIESSLRSVTEIVFPFRALETQKQWLTRYFKKPYELSTQKTAAALSRLNNYLPSFPLGTPADKYSEPELVKLLEFALPQRWRTAMDLKGFIAADNDWKTFVDEVERIERNDTVVRRERNDDDDNDNNKKDKKVKFAKNRDDNKKNGREHTRTTDKLFCKRCGENFTHVTKDCYILKREARERENPGEKAKPFTKRTFRKEVNAMARRAGRHDGLKFVESALKREKGKLAKRDSKKHAKKSVAKKPEPEDMDTSSDESMHHMEERIPRKKLYRNKTVRFNNKGEVVAVDSSASESEDDRKMPAKIAKKKARKVVVDPFESSDMSDEEEASTNKPNKPSKEERAFLKAVSKKDSDSEDSE
jgi:hypothetical protein